MTPAGGPSLTLNWGSATDVGLVRAQNQDGFLATDGLFVAADGMGGHAAGEVASALAIDEFVRLTEIGPWQPSDVVAAVQRANSAITESGRTHPERFGMGTTVTGIALVTVDGESQWAVFNVGDSRVYRFGDGMLSQLTVDHSAVQELVDAGQLTPADARHHPRRNVVTRSLGSDPAPLVDVALFVPVAGDRFLVCTDGLTTELTDADIAVLLRDVADPTQAAQALVDTALAAGGHDNVTVLVIDLIALG